MISLAPLALFISFSFQLDAVQFEGWDPKLRALADRASHFVPREVLTTLPLAPPPTNSDDKTRRELDELLALQKARTPADRRAIAAHLSFDGICSAVLGTIHRELAHAPKTRALLSHVEHDAAIAVFTAKKRFERARPTQLEPRLHPAIAVPKHAAYPSGHAIFSHVVARVLSDIFPDYREVLLTEAKQIAREREIAGVHYPSDSEAGRALGDALMSELAKNATYAKELAAAKAEWPCQGP